MVLLRRRCGGSIDRPAGCPSRKYILGGLKKRMNSEGAGQLLTNCKQLKMTAADGKRRLTDVADTEQLLRIIQSIPSPKAEPFKLWLAQAGRERIEETIDPELTIDRALETYLKKGYSREWINQRLQAILILISAGNFCLCIKLPPYSKHGFCFFPVSTLWGSYQSDDF